MEAYCVKCKTKREMKDPQPLYNEKGSAYTRGVCPVCGTAMMRFGQTEAHLNVPRPKTEDGGRTTDDVQKTKD